MAKRLTSKTSGGAKPNPQKAAFTPRVTPRTHPTSAAAAQRRNDNQSYKLG